MTSKQDAIDAARQLANGLLVDPETDEELYEAATKVLIRAGVWEAADDPNGPERELLEQAVADLEAQVRT